MKSFEYGSSAGNNEERNNEKLNELRITIQGCRSWTEVVNKKEIQYLLSRHLKLAQEWWAQKPTKVEVPVYELKEWQKHLKEELSQGSTIIIDSQQTQPDGSSDGCMITRVEPGKATSVITSKPNGERKEFSFAAVAKART